MPIKVQDFLAEHTFKRNPFVTISAEDEEHELPAFFLHMTQFDELLGDPHRPISAIVFGASGSGKTSHLLEVGRLARQHKQFPALVVRFTEFDLLLDQPVPATLTPKCIDLVCRETLERLHAELEKSPDLRKRLDNNYQMLEWFGALLAHFQSVQAMHYQTTSNTKVLKSLNSSMRSGRAWLQDIHQLAQFLGFTSIYFLIDGVNQWLQNETYFAQSRLAMLQPWLSAIGLVLGNGFAFKFFLPIELEPLMRGNISLLDRVKVYRLLWSENDLLNMFWRRLKSYSLDESGNSDAGFSTRFSDLVDSDLNIDRLLASAAEGSPRELLSIAGEIVEEHCSQTDDSTALIDYELVRAILIARQPNKEWPTSSAGKAVDKEHVRPNPHHGTPLLFFDPKGDLWLDDRKVASKLPKLLNRCMEFLWKNRHREMSYAELEQALYGDGAVSLEERQDPRNSCTKVVQRLRKKLEPEKPASSQTYIEVHMGKGYVLRNYRDI